MNELDLYKSIEMDIKTMSIKKKAQNVTYKIKLFMEFV